MVLATLYMQRREAITQEGKPAWVFMTFNIRVLQPASSDESLNTDEQLRWRATFLCTHQLLDFPATSRLPTLVAPSLLIRREDLLFLQRQPFLAPFTELDRRDLHEDLAHFVSCEATEVRVSGDTAVVSLRRSSPPWDTLPSSLLDSEVFLGPREAIDRLEALEQWAEENPARGEPSVHSLAFVKSPKGWLADYQLPEKAHPATP